MGYTHYWRRPAVLDPVRFKAWSLEVEAMSRALPATTATAGGYHLEDPLELDPAQTEFNAHLVCFNGRGDLGHETFHVLQVEEVEGWQVPDRQGRYGAFCKTARKPYDLLVCASLLSLGHHFPEVTFSSDGTVKDWGPALAFYAQVTGRPEPLLTAQGFSGRGR